MVKSTSDPGYQQCTVSVMDNIADADIRFDENGICNYYHEYLEIARNGLFTGAEGERKLEALVDDIKKAGQGKKYDCVTGISGGVDSSYLIYLAHKLGLRVLIVHFDNGWNSNTAVNNINNIIKKTGFDLFTIVVDWNEFKDLQLAYFKASVVDIEVPTDHAISGTLQRLAAKYGVKHILSGNNIVTEAILPPSWIYNKNDETNLLNIHRKFGKLPLKTYPLYGAKEQNYYGRIKGIHTVKPLNYIEYNKFTAKQTITRELNWEDYGGKHYESVFTKFYQAYILPYKFHIDKRKAHLSTLIFSGQITRDQALQELALPLYEPEELLRDKEYVLKKLGWSESEFEQIMQLPRVEHEAYGKKQFLTEKYPVLKLLKPLKSLFQR